MKRIKNLIDQVGISSPGAKQKDDEIHPHTVERTTVLPSRILSNPTFQAETIQSIDDAVFNPDTDGNIIDVKRLPDHPTQELIHEMCEKLHNQLSAVSKKLSDVILENQPAYRKELQRVRDLQKDLQIGFSTCCAGKKHLLSVTSFVNLRLLVHVQHRKNLIALHDALNTIKTLEHTDVRLRELMEEENYPEAIQLCLECQKVAVAYGQYNCIKDLSSKLQDTIEQIEEQIDVALSKMCNHFDSEMYEKLQVGYKLLGKRQTAVDQLLMHFTTCIHNIAFQTLLGYVQLCTKEPDANLQKKQFNDLCSIVDSSFYIPCLLALCKALWTIMYCYHKVSLWHSEEFSEFDDTKISDEEIDNKYITRKLEHGRHRIWLDVQSRIKSLLLGIDLSSFKYDEFIKVVGIVNKFILVGATFCGSGDNPEKDNFGSTLHEPIYQQSLRYFRAYHKKSLEEMHMFLDNEAWEACPIQKNFSVMQLPEFKFLHEANYKDIIKSSGTKHSEKSSKNMFFNYNDNKRHPFEEFAGKSDDKTNVNGKTHSHSIDDNEMDDELLFDYIEEDVDDDDVISHKENKVVGPLLTNTALNTLRTCGKYLRMCDVLKPIATDVIICMSHLFDYYLISIYDVFAAHEPGIPGCSKKLYTTLSRIKSELIRKEFDAEEKNTTTKVPLPSLSPIVNLKQRSTMFGLPHRITATESLMNLAAQFQYLQPTLRKVIPSSQEAFLQQFYAQTVSTCAEVRSLVYFTVGAGSIDYNSILSGMAEVKWDLKEIMSQHSKYVDALLHHFKLLKSGFSSAANDMPFPDEIEKIIWQHCIGMSGKTFVEGFSNVKKCSNEGRALMQLDFQQFLLKAEEITGVRPAPGKEFVENYIKAYYLTAKDLEEWMKDHPEYSEKQLSALTSCSASSTVGNANRKNKQRMRAMIDDLTKRK
uniref:syndetin-like n=1 Tax=Styela clava TaxID=7725 RepID=UPI00193A1DFB|nr:syndetin-like [Styela clava]